MAVERAAKTREFVAMKSPGGSVFWTGGVFKEIVPFTRMVHTESQADATVEAIRAAYAIGDHRPGAAKSILRRIGG